MWKSSLSWRRRNILRVVILSCVLYVATYIIDSRCGGYWMTPDWHLNDRWSPSAYYWQPAIGHRAYLLSHSDWVGIAYSPLIAIDRMWFHPTIVMGDIAAIRKVDNLHDWQIHPKFRKSHAAKVSVHVRDAVGDWNEKGRFRAKTALKDGDGDEINVDQHPEPPNLGEVN